jgi:hypothetical protein
MSCKKTKTPKLDCGLYEAELLRLQSEVPDVTAGLELADAGRPYVYPEEGNAGDVAN